MRIEPRVLVIEPGHKSHGKERFLATVLAPEKKKMDRIEEQRFKRKQKDILADLAEQKERLRRLQEQEEKHHMKVF